MAKRHLTAPIGPSVAIVQEIVPTPIPGSSFPEFHYEDLKLTCFNCPGLPTRLVIGTFVTDPADPTLAYRLICGHSVI